MKNNLISKQIVFFDAGGGDKPIVRAMWANVCLFGGLGFFIIEIFLRIKNSNIIILDIITISFGIFLLREYFISVAKIIINNNSLVVMLSLHKVILARDEIRSIELIRFNVSNMIKIVIYGKENKSTYHLMWYSIEEDIKNLKPSWINAICTLDGKSLSSDEGRNS